MAVAVAQKALKEGKKLFDAAKDNVYDKKVQEGHRRFVLDVAYLISDLMVLVTEEGKSGGFMHSILHAKFWMLCAASTACYLCTLLFMLNETGARFIARSIASLGMSITYILYPSCVTMSTSPHHGCHVDHQVSQVYLHTMYLSVWLKVPFTTV